MRINQNTGLQQKHRFDAKQIFKQELLACPNNELTQLVSQQVGLNLFVESVESKDDKIESLDAILEMQTDYEDLSNSFNEKHAEQEMGSMSDAIDLKSLNGDAPEIPDDRKLHFQNKETVLDDLVRQISTLDLDQKQRSIGEYLVRSIDENGFLKNKESVIDKLQEYYPVAISEVDVLLEKLQNNLTPRGVLANGFQDSLRIQAQAIPDKQQSIIATRIFSDNNLYELFTKKDYSSISKNLRIDNPLVLEKLFKTIHGFNPKPIQTEGHIAYKNPHKEPDFLIIQKGEHFEAKATRNAIPRIVLNKEQLDYYNTLDRSASHDTPHYKFYKAELDKVAEMRAMLDERVNVLEKVISYILNEQPKYLASHNQDELVPLLVKDVAERFNLDPSTVSRISSEKVLKKDNGELLTLRNLFTQGVKTTQGERLSLGETKELIKDLITREDRNKPLTDIDIEEFLKKEKGLVIGLNRVSKYRQSLDIPDAKSRKTIYLSKGKSHLEEISISKPEQSISSQQTI